MNDNFCVYHKEMPITKKRGQKKRHTHKKGVKGKMNVYRLGNVVVCSRIPIRVDDKKGGGTKDDEDVKALLKTIVFSHAFFNSIESGVSDTDVMNSLGNKQEDIDNINDYLKLIKKKQEDSDKLFDYIMSKKSLENNDLFDALTKFNSEKSKRKVQGTSTSPSSLADKPSEEIAKDFLNFIEKPPTAALHQLNDIVKSKAFSNTMLNAMKVNSKPLIQQIGQKQFDAMIKALDESGTDGIPGTLSTMTSSAFNTLKSGSISLGNFLSPNTGEKPSTTNDTNIQLLWYPQEHMHYSKGRSKGRSYEKYKYGDFVILVEPTKYANTKEFFLQSARQVEDLLANVLNGCSNMLCTKGSVKRMPYRKQVIKIKDETPGMA